MKSFTKLPKYIHTTNAALMFLVAEYIEVVLGIKREDNVKVGSHSGGIGGHPMDNASVWNMDSFNIRIYEGDGAHCTYYNNSSMNNMSEGSVWFVKDITDLFSLIHGPSWHIGDYQARLMTDGTGLKVGCTYVSWETIREIAKYMPAEVVPQPPAPEPADDPVVF